MGPAKIRREIVPDLGNIGTSQVFTDEELAAEGVDAPEFLHCDKMGMVEARENVELAYVALLIGSRWGRGLYPFEGLLGVLVLQVLDENHASHSPLTEILDVAVAPGNQARKWFVYHLALDAASPWIRESPSR